MDMRDRDNQERKGRLPLPYAPDKLSLYPPPLPGKEGISSSFPTVTEVRASCPLTQTTTPRATLDNVLATELKTLCHLTAL